MTTFITAAKNVLDAYMANEKRRTIEFTLAQRVIVMLAFEWSLRRMRRLENVSEIADVRVMAAAAELLAQSNPEILDLIDRQSTLTSIRMASGKRGGDKNYELACAALRESDYKQYEGSIDDLIKWAMANNTTNRELSASTFGPIVAAIVYRTQQNGKIESYADFVKAFDNAATKPYTYFGTFIRDIYAQMEATIAVNEVTVQPGETITSPTTGTYTNETGTPQRVQVAGEMKLRPAASAFVDEAAAAASTISANEPQPTNNAHIVVIVGLLIFFAMVAGVVVSFW